MNMALDEALLLRASAEGAAVLRVYGWSPPAVSMGYFQPRDAVRAPEGVQVVRRITGGGAIWHESEITYSLCVSVGWGAAVRTEKLYELAHLAAVRGFGLEASGVELVPRHASPRTDHAAPSFCFDRHGSYDVVWRGRKLLGSAQRRKRAAVLQHGSLPLAPSRHTMEHSVTLEEITGRSVSYDEAVACFTRGFESVLGMDLVQQEPDEQLLATASALAEHKYASAKWNAKW